MSRIALAFVLSAAVVATASSSAFARQVRIVATGDSNIAGKGVPDADAYPAQLERALRARGLDVVVVNTGRNGEVSAGLLRRLDSAVPPGTDLAIVSIGVNDLVRGAPAEYVRDKNLEIKQALRARGVEILFFGPNQPLKGFQEGISDDPDLHVEKVKLPGQYHLNREGYAHVVRRTLPVIVPMVKKLAAQK